VTGDWNRAVILGHVARKAGGAGWPELRPKRSGFTGGFKRFGGLQTSEEVEPEQPYSV
jgi:hypothetical protein